MDKDTITLTVEVPRAVAEILQNITDLRNSIPFVTRTYTMEESNRIILTQAALGFKSAAETPEIDESELLGY